MSAWRMVPIDDVCEQSITLVDPRAQPDALFDYVDISAVDNVAKRIVETRCLLGKDAPSRARQLLRTGDVLVATTRPNLNAVALVGEEHNGKVASTGFGILRAKPEILPGFLYRWVQSPAFVSEISLLVQGALYPAVTERQLRALMVPLPSLPEQRRIVAALEAQLTAAARARAAVAAQQEAAARIEITLLDEFFPSQGDALPQQPLVELLAAPLRTGLSKPMLPDSASRCLTLSAVRNGTLDFTASKPVDVTPTEAEANCVKAGAFYVVRGNGNRELVGRGALAPNGTDMVMTFPDLLFEVVPDSNRLLPEFLRWAWNSPCVRRQIEDKAQTSAGIFKINQGNLHQIRVPVPSLEEQARIVCELGSRSAVARRLNATLKDKLTALDHLPARLLAQAFAADATNSIANRPPFAASLQA